MVSDTEIQEAGEIIRDGGVVAFPTETVYGLGADAQYGKAVARIFEIKGRPSFDPLIVHVADAEAAWTLADLHRLPEAFRRLPAVLAKAFWPGPLTLVLPKRPCGIEPPEDGSLVGVPDIVTSGLDTVGLRVPAHPVARALIAAAGVPIAAPSANAFGGISPTRAAHVKVDCERVLDGGPCATGVESTVVGFDETGPVVLRLGGTSVEAIEHVLGRQVAMAKPGEKIASPGMLDRHYAPRTPLRLVPRLEDVDPALLGGKAAGLLSLRGEQGRGMGFRVIETLSPTGDLTAAATGLFEAMHRLDAAGLDLIVAEAVPDEGLGRAINDRLRRAATR